MSTRRTKSTPGRKPKSPRQRATKHIGAGVTPEEWPIIERVVQERGQSQSTIIRGAFGLPPASI